MTPAQMDELRRADGIREGHEWEPFEGLGVPEARLRAFLDKVPFAQGPDRRLHAARLAVPASLALPHQPVLSSQQAFGLILNALAGSDAPLADRIVTTSPDVTVSTNLGAWVNRRKIFGREAAADTFKSERIPSTFTWEFSPKGQHIELGIAEMNLFILLSALGLSHSINGERLLPIGTLYDPFIARGLDALNYACYQDARFIVTATRKLPKRTGCATRPAARLTCGFPRGRSSRFRARSRLNSAAASSTAATGCASPDRMRRSSSPIWARSRPKRSRRLA
jgi:pyruvate dehydrogenase E1 component